jgi:predicted permease
MRRFLLKLVRRRRLHEDLEAELAFHAEMSRAHANPIPVGNVSRIKEESLDLWRFSRLENLWRDIVYGTRNLARSRVLVVSALLSFGLGIGVNAVIFSLAVELMLSQPSATDAASVVSVRLGGNGHAPVDVLDFLRRSGIFQDVVGDNVETFLNFNDGHETRPVFAVATTKNYFTVLGILPPAHRTLIGFGFAPDLYVPRYLEDTLLAIYGRLKPGTTLGEVRVQVKTVASRLDVVSPREFKYANAIEVAPLAGFNRLHEKAKMMPVAIFFLVLLVVAALVLLIACVNVAGLLLARASARRRELAIRLSLGASRGRLLQQLLVESLLLASVGAAVGLLMAQATAVMIGRLQLPVPFPLRLMIEPDWRVVVYAAVLTAAATVLAGLLPAWQAVNESIAPDLGRERKLRVRRLLVAGQVAISLVVLATAFLFLRKLLASNSMSPGFDLQRTLRAEINLPSGTYTTPERIGSYVDRTLSELQALPGIEAVAAARIVPFIDMTQFGSTITFPDTGEKANVNFNWNAVSPDFFRVMRIPVLQGRSFDATDRNGDRVAIVNRTFVSRYLGARSAVGRTFLWGQDGTVPFRIVGVVEGTKTMTVGEEDRPQLYQPLAQVTNDRRRLQFVLRSATAPALHLDAVRHALRRIEPGAGTEVATLYSSIGIAFLPSQVGAVLFGTIGLLALVLAAVGLYGMMAYSVARRTQEIGIRLAIGATRSDISRMVLRDAVTLVAVGSVVGLAIALLVTRPLAMFLVANLTPADPLSFVAVVVVLGVTALVASLGPVRRATRVDPASTLRYE